MGFRFRKRPRLFPGVRLNISNSGFTSISVGRRGFTVNIGREGTRTTVGLPGSGMSYTTRQQRYAPGSERVLKMVLVVSLIVGLLYWLSR